MNGGRLGACHGAAPGSCKCGPGELELGYHIRDHRRVGATGAVVLMEPPNGQVTGHWAVCSAVSSCMVVGPCTVHVLSESTHLPLSLPGAHAGSVMVSLNLESRVLVKHKMGPAFSHFVVSEGAFLSAFVVYRRASSCRAHGAFQTRRTPGCRLLPEHIPVLWRLCAVAR